MGSCDGSFSEDSPSVTGEGRVLFGWNHGCGNAWIERRVKSSVSVPMAVVIWRGKFRRVAVKCG